VSPDRIAELLAPFLDASYLEQTPSAATDALFRNISTYIDILLHWNSRINLTAIRDPEEIVTRHFGESLFAARHLLPAATSRIRVADVGSGAGFPGLPLKLWDPEISLTLIESNHKKATFLREVSRALTLTDINIFNARAEDLPKDQRFDIVTLRAVERFDEVFPVSSKLVAIQGSIGLLIGGAQVDRAKSLGPEFDWQAPLPVPQSRSRVLLLGSGKLDGIKDVASGPA
jgi:16S rRNA (guanine527-N7)-methyltransferase